MNASRIRIYRLEKAAGQGKNGEKGLGTGTDILG